MPLILRMTLYRDFATYRAKKLDLLGLYVFRIFLEDERDILEKRMVKRFRCIASEETLEMIQDYIKTMVVMEQRRFQH